MMYENGKGGLPKDEQRAVEWYRKAAERGQSIAQYNLGRMYETGLGGLPKSPEKAMEWYRKAAAQGHTAAKAALRNLGER